MSGQSGHVRAVRTAGMGIPGRITYFEANRVCCPQISPQAIRRPPGDVTGERQFSPRNPQQIQNAEVAWPERCRRARGCSCHCESVAWALSSCVPCPRHFEENRNPGTRKANRTLTFRFQPVIINSGWLGPLPPQEDREATQTAILRPTAATRCILHIQCCQER
jgi:hypothetical protein